MLADAVEGPGDTGVAVLGVQIVQDQEARDQFVAGEARHRVAGGVGQQVEEAGQAGAVEVHEGADQFLGRLRGTRAAAGGQPVQHFLDPASGPFRVDGARGRGGAHPPSPLRPVGTCIDFTVLPPPTYMWTPQGRQGSKLRTARMMSMPLKFSGVFSSKIGVFCTASS